MSSILKSKVVLLSVAGAAAVVAAGAFIGYRAFFAPASDDAIALVPANAFAYANVFFDPSTSQKMAIADLLEKFPEAPTPDEARGRLIELLDESLASIDATFADDVEPWLGDQLAGFAVPPRELGESPEGAFLVESTDAGAAGDFVADAARSGEVEFSQANYNGIEYFRTEDATAVGVVEDFVVIGTERAFERLADVADGGESLAGSDRYSGAVDRLQEDRLATIYFDGRPLFDALGADTSDLGFGALSTNVREPVAGAVFATSDSVTFEASSAIPQEGAGSDLASNTGSGLLPELPAEAWGALGIVNLGESLSGLVEQAMNAVVDAGGDPEQLLAGFEAQTGLDLQEDVLSWMGDAGVFVQGTTPQDVGGAIVIASTDPDQSSRALSSIVDALRAQNIPVGPPTVSGAEGFAIRDPALAGGLNVVAREDRVVIGLGTRATEAALAPTAALTDEPTFVDATDALGGDFAMAAFFDVNAIVRFVANAANLGADPNYTQEVQPWLESLTFVTFGSQADENRLVQRVVVGVD